MVRNAVVRHLSSGVHGGDTSNSAWINYSSIIAEPWFDLMQAAVMHWLGEKLPSKLLDRLNDHGNQTAEAGILWYQDELYPILNPDETWPISRKPLVQLYEMKSDWKAGLLALNDLVVSRDKSDQQTSNQTDGLRMVWWVYTSDSQFELEPREQKLNKKGQWTKGRRVSIKRLCEETTNYHYLTTKDLKIVQAIEKHYLSNYSYYVETTYSLEGSKALLAAMGHPLLYQGKMDGKDSQTVTLEQVSPSLDVIEDQQKKKIHIQLQPYPTVEVYDMDIATHQYYWADSHKLQMIEFSQQQIRISEILGEKGLIAPLSAKKQVLKSIQAITPLVVVHSDIGGGVADHAHHIDVDNTLHCHLFPLKMGDSSGLQISMHQYPLGENGPDFQPGEGRSSTFAEIDGQSSKTTRNLQQEREVAQALVDQLPLPEADSPWLWALEDTELALENLLALQEKSDELLISWPQGEKLKVSREIHTRQMQVKISKDRDWFALDGKLQVDDNELIDMKKLISLLQESPSCFLKMDDGRIIALSKQLRKQLDSLHALSDNGKVHLLATSAIEEATKDMEVKSTKFWRDNLQRLNEAQTLQVELPNTLEADLRDYQIEGFRWLARLAHWGGGACLADDMGLGKTLQALALMVTRAADGPSLVIAPTSVCNNWIEEARRFAPSLRPKVFGQGSRHQMLNDAKPFDLIICSYGLLQVDIERIKAIKWQTIVADEAQAFKNANTKRSKAMMCLQTNFRIITTGTPIENHLGELWNLFRFINPGLLGSLEKFNSRYANPIQLHENDEARLRLKSLIRPFMLRRLKRDVLTELPSRTEIVHHIELNKEETLFYEALRQQALQNIAEMAENPGGQMRFQMLTEITRLRQAACHPRLVISDSTVSSAKLNAFAEIIQELRENQHRTLVFSQFVKHLNLIREYLDQQGIHYQYLDGSTPVKKRKQAVDDFQAGKGELFLISLKAGGSGLNLTAADYVIHMDPWWNPAVEDQASDRAHRMGQTRPVTIYRLVVNGTIEEKIVALHAQKRDLADGLLEGTNSSTPLSIDDLVELIGGTD